MIYNARTDEPVAGLTSITSSTRINLALFSGDMLALRAVTVPSVVGSVLFFEGNRLLATENLADYVFPGNNGTDYRPWDVQVREREKKIKRFSFFNCEMFNLQMLFLRLHGFFNFFLRLFLFFCVSSSTLAEVV